jgi:hypothetical protein
VSVTLFQKLSTVRESKVERARRECRRMQDALASCEQALALAQGVHGSMLAQKQAVALRWRADRLALEAFDADACDCHHFELARFDRRIAEALDAVTRRSKERDASARDLAAARNALIRRQVELTKAQSGVTQHRLLQQRHDEAIEEDELDELAVLRPRQSPLEGRA